MFYWNILAYPTVSYFYPIDISAISTMIVNTVTPAKLSNEIKPENTKYNYNWLQIFVMFVSYIDVVLLILLELRQFLCVFNNDLLL